MTSRGGRGVNRLLCGFCASIQAGVDHEGRVAPAGVDFAGHGAEVGIFGEQGEAGAAAAAESKLEAVALPEQSGHDRQRGPTGEDDLFKRVGEQGIERGGGVGQPGGQASFLAGG